MGEQPTLVATLLLVTPELTRWLSETELRRSVVLLELHPDLIGNGALRLDMDVALNFVSLRGSGPGSRRDRYIACCGVRIEVWAFAGRITDHTPAQQLNVEYRNTSLKRQREGSVTLAPRITAEAGSTKISLKAGEIQLKAGEEIQVEAKYTGTESLLSVMRLGEQAVRWESVLPRGERVVQDFIGGNLALYAECKWTALPAAGEVRVIPTEVRCFDERRRPLGPLKSIAMWYVASLAGAGPNRIDGVTAGFTLCGDEGGGRGSR